MDDTQDVSFFYEDCDKYIFSKNLERDLLRLDYSLNKLEDKIKSLNNTIVILEETDINNIYTKIDDNNKINLQNVVSLRQELYTELFKQFLHNVKTRIKTTQEINDKIKELEESIVFLTNKINKINKIHVENKSSPIIPINDTRCNNLLDNCLFLFIMGCILYIGFE